MSRRGTRYGVDIQWDLFDLGGAFDDSDEGSFILEEVLRID